MDMNEALFLGEKDNQVAVFTPLDALLSEYRKKKEDIIRIAGYVAGEADVMHYFVDGSRVEYGTSSFSVYSVFEQAPALRALDASYWAKAMALISVLDLMPADRRNEWEKQIREHKCPEFEPSTVKATLETFLANRGMYFAERVDGLFRALSGEHVTNAPEAFGKRMILARVLDCYGYINHEQAKYLHDLRCVIAKFMGRDEPAWRMTSHDLDQIRKNELFGDWQLFDGGAFKMRIYKKGTAHMEVHPDIAWRLNQVLAWMHPSAIPANFRKKPKKLLKEVPLAQELVPFQVLKEIMAGRPNREGDRLSFFAGDKPSKRTCEVLQYLGGTPQGTIDWAFDYRVTEVIDTLIRTGQVPETKSHQFYPTCEELASMVVDLADIGENDLCLEPEAGMGGIAMFMPPDRTTCVEISKLHCKVLEAKGFNTVCDDFLNWEPTHRFNRVCMNPPFNEGRDIGHLKRALELLTEDGKLVAILPATHRGRTLVEGWHHEWSQVYTGRFEGTGVSVALVTMTRSLPSA